MSDEAAEQAQPQIEITSSRGFPSWLAGVQASLAITNYQTGKLSVDHPPPTDGELTDDLWVHFDAQDGWAYDDLIETLSGAVTLSGDLIASVTLTPSLPVVLASVCCGCLHHPRPSPLPTLHPSNPSPQRLRVKE